MVKIICEPQKKDSYEDIDVSTIENEMNSCDDIETYFCEHKWTNISNDVAIDNDVAFVIKRFFSYLRSDHGIMVAMVDTQYGTTVSSDMPDMRIVDLWVKDYWSDETPKTIDCLVIESNGTNAGNNVSGIVSGTDMEKLNSSEKIEDYIADHVKKNHYDWGSVSVRIDRFIKLKVPMYEGVKTEKCEISNIKCLAPSSSEVMHTREYPGYSGSEYYFLYDEFRLYFEEINRIDACESCGYSFEKDLITFNDGALQCQECLYCNMYRNESVILDSYDDAKKLVKYANVNEPDINMRSLTIRLMAANPCIYVDVCHGVGRETIDRAWNNEYTPMLTADIPAEIKGVSDITCTGADEIMIFDAPCEYVHVFNSAPHSGDILDDIGSPKGIIVVFQKYDVLIPVIFARMHNNDKYKFLSILDVSCFMKCLMGIAAHGGDVCTMYIHFSHSEHGDSQASDYPIIMEIDMRKHKEYIDKIKIIYAKKILMGGK